MNHSINRTITSLNCKTKVIFSKLYSYKLHFFFIIKLLSDLMIKIDHCCKLTQSPADSRINI